MCGRTVRTPVGPALQQKSKKKQCRNNVPAPPQIAKKACLKGLETLSSARVKGCDKVSMSRVEPFGKVAERFASQQGTRFSVRSLVRFPQAFITRLFQTFQKVIPPSVDKIEPLSEVVLLQRDPTHFFHPLFKALLLQKGPTPFFIPPLLTSS
ncbi:hypothetical protein AVEN_109470-1 [Araneus ventricosus]|uniref:Uncharacterized protein n=1 Tax=Araneus ventricosus TaxID=182803 RepID=A0A4Y2SQK9_ARAVE|nr:hypothetical protein AVEN_109470-1 [Araneus ventricosus]